MLAWKDKVGYVPDGLGRPLKRRTCKEIKGQIYNILLFDIGGLNLIEEPGMSIAHEAFVRAVDHIEEYGYLTLRGLEYIVRDEYQKTTNLAEPFDFWFGEYDSCNLFEETSQSVEAAEKSINRQIMQECTDLTAFKRL